MGEYTNGLADSPQGVYRQFAGLASARKKEPRQSVKRNYVAVDCFRAGESGVRNCFLLFSAYMCVSAIRSS
jgi:hypothetical protein